MITSGNNFTFGRNSIRSTLYLCFWLVHGKNILVKITKKIFVILKYSESWREGGGDYEFIHLFTVPYTHVYLLQSMIQNYCNCSTVFYILSRLLNLPFLVVYTKIFIRSGFKKEAAKRSAIFNVNFTRVSFLCTFLRRKAKRNANKTSNKNKTKCRIKMSAKSCGENEMATGNNCASFIVVTPNLLSRKQVTRIIPRNIPNDQRKYQRLLPLIPRTLIQYSKGRRSD